jgi:hypothetical protein
MKFNTLIITAIVSLTSLSAILPAKADYVRDELNRTNRLINEAGKFNSNVLQPAVRRNEIYLNNLYNACLRGNSVACNQHLRAQKRIGNRLNRAIQRSHRRLY